MGKFEEKRPPGRRMRRLKDNIKKRNRMGGL